MKEYVCWVFLISLAGTILAGLYNRLSLTKYRVSNVRIPDGFDGYRIAVVSDLHAERFGKKQQELIALLRKVPCDLICLTGDIISRDAADFAPVWAFIDAMAGIPMVYISGNHEPSLEDYDLLLNGDHVCPL